MTGEGPAGVVRPAGVVDAGAIAAVHVASWQAAYRGLLPDEYLDSLSVPVRTGQWESVLTDPDVGHVLVVAAEGRVVGFAHAGPSGDTDARPLTAELVTIYLHPDAWGRGLGRQLQGEILRRLTGDGFRSVTLWMLASNDRARRFYLRQGWSLTEGLRTQVFGGQEVTDHRFVRYLGDRGAPEEEA